MRACAVCGESIEHRAANARYCSQRCNALSYRRRHGQPEINQEERACQECGESLAGTHPSRRYCDSRCQERTRWRVDREERSARNREYSARVDVRARRRIRYASDAGFRERMKVGVREWRDANPARAREQYREKMRNRPHGEYAEILRQDVCSYCGGSADEVDHIEPIARGGLNEPDNYTAACGRCNSRKHAHTLLRALLNRRLEQEALDAQAA